MDYYDSLYSKIPENAEYIIAFLLGQNSYNQVLLNCIPIHKQAGTIDCGLCTIAVATSLAHDLDSETQIYQQDEMRQHLITCSKKKQMTTFPVMRTKHIRKSHPLTIILYYCPMCKKDDGRKMVECEKCGNWFHEVCVPPFDMTNTWYCVRCS